MRVVCRTNRRSIGPSSDVRRSSSRIELAWSTVAGAVKYYVMRADAGGPVAYVTSVVAPTTAYDAAMVMVAALTKAEESGEAAGSDAYKQALIDAIASEGASVEGITSASGYTFDEYNNPIKDAVIMTIASGEAVFKEMY